MHKKTTLPNGLRILTVPMKDTPTATVLILVGTGSKYEVKSQNGISHFLEHMTFKGTKKRPTPLSIAEPLDRIGGQYNAFTGQEYTGYYAKADAAHSDLALDIIADITLNPVFNQKEINKERGVIIEEINMNNDNPMRKIGDLWHELLYGDQPAGWDIAGRKEVIVKLNKEDFVSYHDKQYVSDNVLAVVSGNVNPEPVLTKIKTLFKNIKINHHVKKPPVKESQRRPEALVHYKATDQSHIMLGVRAYDMWDERRYAMEVLATILGGGMSSRLFQLLRDKLGAAYYVRTWPESLTDHGYLVTSAGIDNKRSDLIIKSILKEYQKVKKEKVSDSELAKAKEHIEGSLMLSIETSDEVAMFYGFQELLKKKILSPDELIQKIRAVTAAQVQEAAKEIFRPEKLNLAVIGPFSAKGGSASGGKDTKSFENLLKL